VLLAASIAALVWANVDPSGYQDVWHTQFTVSIGGHGVTDTLLHAVNDGLMGIFFLVVGLEVKRELTIGELAHAPCGAASTLRGRGWHGGARARLPGPGCR